MTVRMAIFIWLWLLHSVGAPGRAPLPGITNPGITTKPGLPPVHIQSAPHPPPSFHASTPSFPRKRESTPCPLATPGITGVLDSGLRRNDGGGRRFVMAARRKSPQPPFCERGAFYGLRQCPAIRHSNPPLSVIPAPIPSFPRQRESAPRPFATPGLAGGWIPAYAGMLAARMAVIWQPALNS